MAGKPSLTQWGTTALLCVATLTIMVGSAIAPALPRIAGHVGMAENASWLITLPSLGVVVFGPLGGRMIDRMGGRNAVMLGLLLYGFLGVIGAVITSVPLLLVDRFLLGGATALVMAGGTVLISEFFVGGERLRMIARQWMAIELGGVVFLSAAGLMAEISWRLPFGLYLLAWLFCILVAVSIPDQAPAAEDDAVAQDDGVNWVGDIYFAAALSLILFFAGFITLPGLLADMGASEAVTGYYLAFVSLVAVCAAALMPRVQSLAGTRAVFLVAFVCYAVAHTIYLSGPSLPALIFAGFMMGGAFGFSIPLANHEVVERSPRAVRGRNLAYLSSAVFLGQFLSSFLELFSPERAVTFGSAAGLAVIGATIYAILAQRAPPIRLPELPS